MNNTDVLVLNGSPGSGKSTLANAIDERLRTIGLAHAVIDVDELCRVAPEPDRSLKWRNLRAMWPNYSAIPNLKVILPVCIDSKKDLEELRNAAPSEKFTICQLVADESILKDRVTRREPNEYWQRLLISLVDRYLAKDPDDRFGDFRVRTDDKTIEDAAQEIIGRLGWSNHRNR
jgi:predicted kinase